MNLLTESDFLAATDPIPVIEAWLVEAAASEPNDGNAMALATAGSDGLPNVRMVLLKGFDERGFVFYTNAESAKGRELAQNPQAALVLHWKSLRRQVRARGRVTPVSGEEADAYFASRPLGSRIGAWASLQSRPLDRRETLEAAIREVEARYPNGTVPRPPHWPGYRIEPSEIELWQDRPSRLHDRIRFTRNAGGWDRTRLYP